MVQGTRKSIFIGPGHSSTLQREENRQRQYVVRRKTENQDGKGNRDPCTSKHGQHEDMQEAATEQGKTAPEKDNPGPLKSSFTGFLHFAADRTLSGWELLCRMGKHTSKEFLYDREHVRVWKCRKTGTKVRSKSRSKTRPGQHPQPRKHPYTGKSANGGTPKSRSKNEVQNDPKMMGK